ncbi:MAG: multicopper oxidase [Meiothermus sp.]|nr:multicopper oxidase [Meiothermus sp.]
MISRRQVLGYGALSGVGLIAACAAPPDAAQEGLEEGHPGHMKAVPTGNLLSALNHPKFVQPVPNPLDPSFKYTPNPGFDGQGQPYNYRVGVGQFQQNLLGPGFPSTTVWGYGQPGQTPTYPGRTFEVVRGQRTRVNWTNNLPVGPGHVLPVDSTLHWAFGHGPHAGHSLPQDGVPLVTHLHGGHSEAASDGLPDDWFTPNFAMMGPGWTKQTYVYDNDQPAANLWYHDHALGITRLNVYAGLAGLYFIRDGLDTGRPDNPLGLPAFPYEIPLVIQDRFFDINGQLFYPSDFALAMVQPGFAPWPGGPSALPEFFGNFILVNGKTWPFLNVEPRKYRLRLLNGSDSRFYQLRIAGGPPMWVIGNDGGLLPAPVQVSQLTIGPGERYDVVVDFAGFAGQSLNLRNTARAPFPGGVNPEPRTVGQVMQFRVGGTVSRTQDNRLPASLGAAPSLPAPVRTRQLLLLEGTDRYGRIQPLLGEVAGGTYLWDDPTTEKPALNTVETWEIFNATVDAHPMHLHLVNFRIQSRQPYKATVVPKVNGSSIGGRLNNIRLVGGPRPPAAEESGWKDTAVMYPGEVTRVTALFDRPGTYVWHCHILSHEDHEMMRRFEVV